MVTRTGSAPERGAEFLREPGDDEVVVAADAAGECGGEVGDADPVAFRAAGGLSDAVEVGDFGAGWASPQAVAQGGFVAGPRHDVGGRQIRGTVGGADGVADGGEREEAPGEVALNGGFGLRATGLGDGAVDEFGPGAFAGVAGTDGADAKPAPPPAWPGGGKRAGICAEGRPRGGEGPKPGAGAVVRDGFCGGRGGGDVPGLGRKKAVRERTAGRGGGGSCGQRA